MRSVCHWQAFQASLMFATSRGEAPALLANIKLAGKACERQAKGGSITVPLTSCLTGLELAV
jgi:hypothetical protein